MKRNSPRSGLNDVFAPFLRFFRLEAASGILLLAATALALLWANSPLRSSYVGLFSEMLTLGTGELGLSKPLLLWINDGLMAVFFLLVGLEVKREIRSGELSSLRSAALPLAAAVGGMLVPAGIYALVNQGGIGTRGWGIPMATDIAFALGILALIGSRAPLALKVFLTAVAIVDDIGAVLVIALFYTAELDVVALGVAGVTLAGLAGLNRLRIVTLGAYLFLGVVLWVALVKSGVHATLAGVLVALTIPADGASHAVVGTRSVTAPDPARRLEHVLHPWVAFGIVPLFALANAGVALGGEAVVNLGGAISTGIILGLVVGKQVGILGFSYLALRSGMAKLPEGLTWRHLHGAAALSGIGFTMSLFIGGLALPDPALLDQAKVGVLVASVLSAGMGWMILARGRGVRQQASDTSDVSDGRPLFGDPTAEAHRSTSREWPGRAVAAGPSERSAA